MQNTASRNTIRNDLEGNILLRETADPQLTQESWWAGLSQGMAHIKQEHGQARVTNLCLLVQDFLCLCHERPMSQVPLSPRQTRMAGHSRLVPHMILTKNQVTVKPSSIQADQRGSQKCTEEGQEERWLQMGPGDSLIGNKVT